MLVYGVVAEFNPFHNGHKFLVDSVKKDGDYVTAVMSESFVQRGEGAIMRASPRVKAALLSGVDIVLSLPVTYSVASAEKFAFGGVYILNSTGVAEGIAFGAETDEKLKLYECAEALLNPDFNNLLTDELKSGVSFPKAREQALKAFCGEKVSRIISTPNNILAVEYIKALKKLGSPLEVICVKRKGALHDEITSTDTFKSASQIREELLKENRLSSVPEKASEIYLEEIKNKKAPADFRKSEIAILSALRTKTADDFLLLPDVSEGLNNRLYESVCSSVSLSEVLEKCKTKRYTYSRLKRIVLCSYLGITKELADMPVPYIRVLGFNADGEKLLHDMKKKSSLPVVTNYSDIKKLGKNATDFFRLESRAKDLFSLTLPEADICNTLMTDRIIKTEG